MSINAASTYTRLADNEIRLLLLDPSWIVSSQPLSFQLITAILPLSSHSLNPRPPTTSPQPPKFIAISHIWDPNPNPRSNPSNHTTILINNQPHRIPHTLYTTLLDLLPDLNNTFPPIWIDPLCINYADPAESSGPARGKTAAAVYRHAERVIVYLGPSTDNPIANPNAPPRLERAVAQMARIGGEVASADGVGAMILTDPDLLRWDEDFAGCEDREEKLRVRERLESLIERERGSAAPWGKRPGLDVDAAYDVLHTPWFGSVWAVPVLLGVPAPVDGEGDVMRRDGSRVVFAVGKARIEWTALWGVLVFMVVWLQKEGRAVGKDGLNAFTALTRMAKFYRHTRMVLPRRISDRPGMTLGLRTRLPQGRLDCSLRELLMDLYMGNCDIPLSGPDPMDRLWAIRGLVTDRHALDDIGADLTGQQTLVRLARTLYRQGNLDFLSLCRERSQGLPSWVPDWTKQQRPPWLGFKTGDKTQLFDAGKATSVTIFEDESNDTTLCLKGFVVDTIQEVRHAWTARLDEAFDWNSCQLRIADLESLIALSPRYSPEQKASARWRVPIADRLMDETYQTVRTTAYLGAEKEFCELELEVPKHCLRDAPSPLPPAGSSGHRMMSTLHSLWSSRSFTSSTGYVGLCPSSASHGDIVFIPSGSHCPYVLRRVNAVPGSTVSSDAIAEKDNEAWELLGEAYVHGIMDGELDLGNKEAEARKFRLV
ncbi:hypothetical protein VTJ49DRAFT_1271 [Mycothermus thermophilus]|uniref:Heterokaryon incompatibility domain-containing protein n=1 Tax=Humicola insolens TaxID=85995 RepID=A0ABR3VD29_HUMIN